MSGTAVDYRIVWVGKWGKESSRLIGEFERACIIADSLGRRSSREHSVCVIDAETHKIVYSTYARRPGSRIDSRAKRKPTSSGRTIRPVSP